MQGINKLILTAITILMGQSVIASIPTTSRECEEKLDQVVEVSKQHATAEQLFNFLNGWDSNNSAAFKNQVDIRRAATLAGDSNLWCVHNKKITVAQKLPQSIGKTTSQLKGVDAPPFAAIEKSIIDSANPKSNRKKGIGLVTVERKDAETGLPIKTTYIAYSGSMFHSSNGQSMYCFTSYDHEG